MFSGIFAPIPTPFLSQEVAWDRLRGNLAKWAQTALDGVVVLGSNGEFVLLDREEKERMIAYVRENFPPGKKVIAGTGGESTRETISLTRFAASAGADAALALNPSYYKESMTEGALKAHYLEVADASPIPVILYNMPRNTGINLSASLVIELSQHENIVGVKDSSGNIVQISEIVAGARESFCVFAGSGSFLLVSLVMGAVGGTLAVANIMPNECAAVMDLFRQGRLQEARMLQNRILPVNAAVTTRWGVAGLKAAMDMLGYFGGEPRRPLVPLADNARKELRLILERAGLLTGENEGCLSPAG